VAGRARSQWTPVLPVPDTAPAAPLVHSVRGPARHVHEYRDGDGRLLGHVCTFARSTDEEISLTRTWCRNAEGEHAWRWMVFPPLRPLYGLDRLAEAPSAPVLVVFSERCADRAQPGFDGYVVVSWPGGVRAVDQVDWSPLRDRMVAIWPDHGAQRTRVAKGDPAAGAIKPKHAQPAYRAAMRIAEISRGFRASPWAIIDAPAEDLPDGWNIAAALDAGWTFDRLLRWMEEHLGDTRAPAAAPAGAPPAIEEEWSRTLLRKDGHGPILAELHNVIQILGHHRAWRGVIYEDSFAHAVKKAKAPPFAGARGGEWTDTDDSFAHAWLSSETGILKLRTSLVAEAVQAVAKLHARNPLVEFLQGLNWDRRPRLDRWLLTYCGAGDRVDEDDTAQDIEAKEAYYLAVGRMWLMGAVKRALAPGVKFDYVLILEGQGGLGKSSAINVLGGEWAMDTPFSLSMKEGWEALRGKWIVEISELDSFNKVESTTAKTFFSRTSDRFRLPYGKRSQDFERACVFAGTTNENEYFRDMTGNRRYWPVHCRRTGFDLAALRRNRDQLLAEAVHRVQAGERIFPTPEEEALCHAQQERREIADPWLAVVDTYLMRDGADMGAKSRAEVANQAAEAARAGKLPAERRGELLTMRELLGEALKIPRDRLDERAMATRVGRCLRKLGWVKREARGTPERFFYEKGGQTDE
jgi:putative DNA primase/helicase